MTLRPTSNPMKDEKMFRPLGYLLVFLIMACGVMTISGIIHVASSSWHAGIIAAVLLLVVVDRLFTYRSLKSLTPLSSEWALAIGAQWIVILLFLRLLLSYADGLDAFRADLSLFARGQLVELLTLEFVFGSLLALLAWYLTGHFLRLLDEIGLDQELALQEETAHIQSDTVPARQRLVNMVFSMGIVLVVLTALARVNMRTILANESGIPGIEVSRFSGGEAGTLLFFVFGLALLSLSRLVSLETRWKLQRIPVSSNQLVRQWGAYSVLFLLIVAVIVSLLPAGDSLGLFAVLGMVLDFLLRVLFFIGQLLLVLISLIFTLPLLLLRGDSTPPENLPDVPLLPTMPAEPAAPAAGGNEVLNLIRSIILWGALLVIVVFAFRQFVRQHGGIRAAFGKSRLADWLILAWQWLYRNVDKTRGDLSRAITDGWQSLVSRLDGKRILPRPNLISLRSLDPRQRVFFFYLALVRRGGEQGLARKPAQTPAEYARTMEQALPSSGEDIASITEAFIEARYSRQEVDSGKANMVKATWSRIRRALQARSKGEQSPNK